MCAHDQYVNTNLPICLFSAPENNKVPESKKTVETDEIPPAKKVAHTRISFPGEEEGEAKDKEETTPDEEKTQETSKVTPTKLTDAERAKKRAERFGFSSEETRKAERVKRFGTSGKMEMPLIARSL